MPVAERQRYSYPWTSALWRGGRSITQAFGINGEQGIDVGLPQGSALYAVTGGSIENNLNWTAPGHPVGWAVVLHGDDGNDYLYGHVSQLRFKDGQHVSAGDVLALSGGQPGTPGAGDSTGPHVEFQYHPARGRPVDPLGWLDDIFSGFGAPPQTTTGAEETNTAGLVASPGGVLAYQGSPCESWSSITQSGNGVLGFVTGVTTYLGQPCIWKRLLLFTGGVAAILIGFKMVGRPEPLSIVTAAPGKLAGAVSRA